MDVPAQPMEPVCCTADLAKYLPVPTVEYDGAKYYLDYDRPHSIGKVRDFMGTAGVVLRAYAWTMMLGADGLRECADVSVINNNYLEKKLLTIKGLSEAFAGNGYRRQEQVRYTWEELTKETGVGTDDINARICGLRHSSLLDQSPPVGNPRAHDFRAL